MIQDLLESISKLVTFWSATICSIEGWSDTKEYSCLTTNQCENQLITYDDIKNYPNNTKSTKGRSPASFSERSISTLLPVPDAIKAIRITKFLRVLWLAHPFRSSPKEIRFLPFHYKFVQL